MQGILAHAAGRGNKIKSCKKILINQAEKGYGVSDHYVNSLKHLYVYVSNDIMQYLRWRQSSVKRRETWKLLHSFLKCFSFFVRDFFSL